MPSHELSEKLLNAMINADRSGAAQIIDEALALGIDPNQVIARVLDPAIVRLGQLWEEQAMSLAQNFVAAKIAEDALLRCIPTLEGAPQGSKGAVVIGNVEDDFHSLGRRAVGLFLEKALEVNAHVIGASAMMQTTALNIRKLRRLIDERGLTGRLKLAVGGAVFNWRPELVAEVGGDGTAHNAVGADQLFLRLQAEAKGVAP